MKLSFLASCLTLFFMCGCANPSPNSPSPSASPSGKLPAVHAQLQSRLETIDAALRSKYNLLPSHTAVGVLDLQEPRLALIHPDQLFYGASVPKIAILLAYFELRLESAAQLDPAVRQELGEMIKISSNELAAKYSMLLGLSEIRRVLDKYRFYDARQGGGIWVGKHYGITGERVGDPLGDHSHAVTVRQLLRFYQMLHQGALVSPLASQVMLEIFQSPQIPHDPIKFVKGLSGREVEVLRKSGSWENWLHDSAIIRGPGRCYILVGLTENQAGDAYLADLAAEVDLMMAD